MTNLHLRQAANVLDTDSTDPPGQTAAAPSPQVAHDDGYRGPLHDQITDARRPALRRYQDVVIGSSSLWELLRYELIVTTCSWLPGAAGLVLRSVAYRHLLGQVGGGCQFGRNVVLRYPRKIQLGRNTILDDGCVLDARGDSNRGIQIGNDVLLARNTILGCKNGDITIGNHVGLGAQCLIHAIGRSGVRIGNDVVIGAFSYLVGGGQYRTDRHDVPICRQGQVLKGGITIADDVWLGARVTVLDGIAIGRGAVVGAGAVVTRDVPPYAIAVGVPARLVGSRDPAQSPAAVLSSAAPRNEAP